MSDNRFLLWLDFETNGLPLKDVEIIEVGWIVTDRTPQYNILNYGQNRINLSDDGLANMPSVVRQMHADTGLLKEIYQAPVGLPVGRIDIVDEGLYHDVLTTVKDENAEITLAGSGVSHFDSTLLREKMPLTYDILHGYNDRESGYLKQTYDIGVVRRFLNNQDTFNFTQYIEDYSHLYMPFPDEVDMVLKPHRALYDCFAARAEALTYTQWIAKRQTAFEAFHMLREEKRISEAD